MTYSHFIHRHKFAVWCAARAVQRKFAKTIFLRDALEKCGIVVQNDQTALSIVAHRPIDRMILQNISKDKSINNQNRMYWKAINWKELNKLQYQNLIKDFRQVINDKPFGLLRSIGQLHLIEKPYQFIMEMWAEM